MLALEIGERIQATLDARGMTQLDLAHDLRVAPSIVNRWCRGSSSPNVASVVRICEALEVSADYLLGREDPPHPTPPRAARATNVAAMADALAASSPPRQAKSNRRRP